jgi:sec-independent protein translocase protein TatB
VGFGEILLIMVIALVVLGPEKLPKLAADIGRWTGRARAMARQLRAQLDQEIQLEEARREAQRAPPPAPPAAAPAPVTALAELPAAPAEVTASATEAVAADVGHADGGTSASVVPPAAPAPLDVAERTGSADGQH